NVVPLAPSLPAARAAFAEPLACALLAIERARIEAGQTVGGLGHGAFGCLLGVLARAGGARVMVVGKARWRVDRPKRLGSARGLEATAAGSVVEEIRALTAGRGADVVIEATGRPEVWEQAVDAVGRGGTVVFFGGCAPGTSIRLDTRRAHYEELALL